MEFNGVTHDSHPFEIEENTGDTISKAKVVTDQLFKSIVISCEAVFPNSIGRKYSLHFGLSQ